MVTPKYTVSWGDLRTDIENLALTLNAYSQHLDEKNDRQQKRQKLFNVPRPVGQYATMEMKDKTDMVKDRYTILDNTMASKDMFQYVLFDEQKHSSGFKNANDKFYFLEKIELSMPINMLTYSPGGPLESLMYLWKVPTHTDSSSEMLTASIHIYEKLKPLLPEYHTRAMRKRFLDKYKNIHAVGNIPKHI